MNCARESDCAVRRIITAAKQTLTEPITQTHNFEFWTAHRTDSAAAAAAAPDVETKRNQRRSQNQPTRYYDQTPAMNWDHAVSWGRGVWVSVSDIGRVGSGWPLGRVGQSAAAAPGVETKPNQRRTQSQPTRYYDQAPAMNWDHAVS